MWHFHALNCKSHFAISFTESIKCNIQYFGESQTEFNIRLNNHCKDGACKHFNQNHHFNNDAKLTLIENLNLKNPSSQLKTQRLKESHLDQKTQSSYSLWAPSQIKLSRKLKQTTNFANFVICLHCARWHCFFCKQIGYHHQHYVIVKT